MAIKKTSAEEMEKPQKQNKPSGDSEEREKREVLKLDKGEAVAPVMLVNAVDLNTQYGETTMLVLVDPDIDNINELDEYVMFVDKGSTFKRMFFDIMLEEGDDEYTKIKKEFKYIPLKIGKSKPIKSKKGNYYNELRYQILDEDDYPMIEDIKEFYESGGTLEALRAGQSEEEAEEAEEAEEEDDTGEEVEGDEEEEMLEFAEQMVEEKKAMPKIITQLMKLYEVDEDRAMEIAKKANKKKGKKSKGKGKGKK